MEDIKEESKKDLMAKEPGKEQIKKTKTVILHNRELTEDEQHILGLIFPRVVQFAFSFHCIKEIDSLISDGECLIVNISKKNPKNVNWYHDQKTENCNVVVIATKLKKQDKLYMIGTLGMLPQIDRYIHNVERLYQKCTPLQFCQGFFCCI